MQETLSFFAPNSPPGSPQGFHFVSQTQDPPFGRYISTEKAASVTVIAQTFQAGRREKPLIAASRLPAKVLENCQRTGRVVIISELEKKVSKDKKLKQELIKVLSEFIPKPADPDGSDYADCKKYYQSLNYSRVRIGHKQFIKKILSNLVFHSHLAQIFGSKALYNSEKARKNEKSPIEFEERKKILEKVLLDYRDKFQSALHNHECLDLSSNVETIHCELEKEKDGMSIKVSISLPVIPEVLNPQAYRAYMTSQGFSY